MSYTSKYAQSEMSKVTDGKPKKRLTEHKTGGNGQNTKAQDRKDAKRAKHNTKVNKRRAKDIEKGKHGNLSKRSRTYRI
jgi:hypothetical protein